MIECKRFFIVRVATLAADARDRRTRGTVKGMLAPPARSWHAQILRPRHPDSRHVLTTQSARLERPGRRTQLTEQLDACRLSLSRLSLPARRAARDGGDAPGQR
jgi:hypothetical protein